MSSLVYAGLLAADRDFFDAFVAVVVRLGVARNPAFCRTGLRIRFALGAGFFAVVAGISIASLAAAAGFTARFAVTFLVVVVVVFPISSIRLEDVPWDVPLCGKVENRRGP